MASLKITLKDASGEDLDDHIVVDLFPIESTAQPLQAVADIKGSLTIKGVSTANGAVYRVQVTPANHRMVQGFVSLSERDVAEFSEIVVVDPSKVNNIVAPQFDSLSPAAKSMLTDAEVPRFNDGAAGFLQGTRLYAALDRLPLLKACFLNITAKSAATKLPDSQCVIDHFKGMVRIEQDRLFVKTSAALVEETAHSNAFHAVSPALHDPLPGYRIVSSFKTFDKFGNLQLTFQRMGNTGDEYAVDVDIDDAQGVEHVGQVVGNTFTGPTNPYNIHDILLQQNPVVDPGYKFVFAAKAEVAQQAAAGTAG